MKKKSEKNFNLNLIVREKYKKQAKTYLDLKMLIEIFLFLKILKKN